MKKNNPQSLLFSPNTDDIVDIPVEQLHLDAENPRLAAAIDSGRQDDLLKVLWTSFDVKTVAWSIAENGFFRSEPLLVIIKNPKEMNPAKRRYIVVEGNRRLAAVRLLRDENLRLKMGATNLPEISKERYQTLDSIPAIVYPDRGSLWTSLGFRHINGVKPWDSFSKAKYISEVFEKFNVPLTEIAERIGDGHSTVKRLYRGYRVLQQAEASGQFDRHDSERGRFYFSHLYTAVDQKQFQDFLGIDPKAPLSDDPVPRTKIRELGEFMTWLYGKKSADIEPVVKTQNPDLNILREVVTNPSSLSALRSGYSLRQAYDIVVGDRNRFRDAVTKAKLEMQNAKATVTTGYFGEEDLYKTLQDIALYASSIEKEMREKRDQLALEGEKSVH